MGRRSHLAPSDSLTELAAKAQPLLNGGLNVVTPPPSVVLRSDLQRLTQAHLLHNSSNVVDVYIRRKPERRLHRDRPALVGTD